LLVSFLSWRLYTPILRSESSESSLFVGFRTIRGIESFSSEDVVMIVSAFSET